MRITLDTTRKTNGIDGKEGTVQMIQGFSGGLDIGCLDRGYHDDSEFKW